jgi:hypothetical protein
LHYLESWEKRKKERSKERKKIVYKQREESKVGDEVYQVETEVNKKKKNRLPEANITQAKHTIQCKLNVDFQELILRILGSRC